MVKHWQYAVTNGKSLQAVNSKSCGDYALLYLKAKARGRALQDFLNDFSDYDYVSNDHKVGQRVKQLIVSNESVWHSVSKPLSSVLLLLKKINKRMKMYKCVCHFVFHVMQVEKPFRFHTPSCILVVGPSGCGKTVFKEKLLLENRDLFEKPPTQVHYCYGAWQDRFKPMQDRGVVFHEGIPDHPALVQWFPQGQGVLVFDDLMDEGSHDKRVLDLFTKNSSKRHGPLFVPRHFSRGQICQKYFPQCPLHRGFQEPAGSTGSPQCVASIVSHDMERQFGHLSSGHRKALWVFGVGFAPGVVRSTTVVEPCVKRRRMDAHVSKASQRSGCQVKDYQVKGSQVT